MKYSNENDFPRGTVILVALLGLILCVFELSSKNGECLTQACSVQQSFTLFGFSLWWFGMGLFSILFILAILNQNRIAGIISGLALFGDCFLLLIMLFSAPCIACMTMACLIALIYGLFTRRRKLGIYFDSEKHINLKKVLLRTWGILFIMLIGQVLHNLASPWAIYGPDRLEKMTALAYFSPNCPACRQLIMSTPDAEIPTIRWCPVPEDSESVAYIAYMKQKLDEGMSFKEAFIATKDAQNLEIPKFAIPMQIRLLINHAHVLAGGRNALPHIVNYGIPRAFTHKRVTRHSKPSTQDDDEFSFLNAPVNECVGGKRDCKDEQ